MKKSDITCSLLALSLAAIIPVSQVFASCAATRDRVAEEREDLERGLRDKATEGLEEGAKSLKDKAAEGAKKKAKEALEGLNPFSSVRDLFDGSLKTIIEGGKQLQRGVAWLITPKDAFAYVADPISNINIGEVISQSVLAARCRALDKSCNTTFRSGVSVRIKAEITPLANGKYSVKLVNLLPFVAYASATYFGYDSASDLAAIQAALDQYVQEEGLAILDLTAQDVEQSAVDAINALF